MVFKSQKSHINNTIKKLVLWRFFLLKGTLKLNLKNKLYKYSRDSFKTNFKIESMSNLIHFTWMLKADASKHFENMQRPYCLKVITDESINSKLSLSYKLVNMLPHLQWLGDIHKVLCINIIISNRRNKFIAHH